MGTRAQFFIGNPMDMTNREWLGCVAWDGYPDGDCGNALRESNTEEEFRAGVASIKVKRDDFTDPAIHSFPFPWRYDLFLTDVTYAFFDGVTQATCYHAGWRPLRDFFAEGNPYEDDAADELPRNVPAPSAEGKPGPDSIIIISAHEE